MMWSFTGNKWLDYWTRKAMNFQGELDGFACTNILTEKEIEFLKKQFKKLNSFNLSVHRRIIKENKKKKKLQHE